MELSSHRNENEIEVPKASYKPPEKKTKNYR